MAYSLSIGFIAFLLAVVVGRPLVEFLRLRRLGKAVSADGPPATPPRRAPPPWAACLSLVLPSF